jgi:ribosome-associated protein
MKKSPAPRRPRPRTSRPRYPSPLTQAIDAANDKKAIDLVVLDLKKGDAFTDYFVICTGANTRQVQAIADAIQQALTATGTKAALVEGTGRAEWVLIDYFDFIFHIFTPATRQFYDLERLWGDAKRIEIPA